MEKERKFNKQVLLILAKVCLILSMIASLFFMVTLFGFIFTYNPLAIVLFGLSILSFMFCLTSYLQIENSKNKKDLLVFGILSIFFGYGISGIFMLCAKDN